MVSFLAKKSQIFIKFLSTTIYFYLTFTELQISQQKVSK